MDSSDESSSNEPDNLVSILQFLIHNSGQDPLISLDESEFYGDESSDLEATYDDDDDDDDMNGSTVLSTEIEKTTKRIDESHLKQDVLLSTGRIQMSHRSNSIVDLIKKREVGMSKSLHFSQGDKCLVSASFLPNKGRVISQYHNKVFCGTYSRDGDLFLTACQDCNIRLYKTTGKKFKLYKTIKARDVGWSILDTAFSPDGSHLVYSSWSECFHLCSIVGEYERHEALPLCPDDRRFCIFSLAFSHDGHEVLGGANDGYLYIYDLESKQRSLKIDSHENDVNSVAFADSSSHILFSGGDDGLCKVWDRRTLNESNPLPVGTLAGHRDGITYVDSKGDGRYLITNCKDQTIKLWDMRWFSSQTGIESTRMAVNATQWDYRWQKAPKKHFTTKKLLNGDTSLMTYTGHSVLRTLIRCHFSPALSTGQRYIYTGCASGLVVIYDVLTGQKVKCLGRHNSCVRDVSWHPYRPEIVSTSWDGTVYLCFYEGDSDCEEGGEEEDIPETSSRYDYNLRPRSTRQY